MPERTAYLVENVVPPFNFLRVFATSPQEAAQEYARQKGLDQVRVRVHHMTLINTFQVERTYDATIIVPAL